MSVNLEELKQQIELLCIERGLEFDDVMESIKSAIAGAYRREFGDKEKGYEADFDITSGKYKVYEIVKIVDEDQEILSPKKEISIVEARLSNPNARVGDIIKTELSDLSEINFGRVASQVAKQVLRQTVGNIKHNKTLEKYKDKIGTVVTVEVDAYKKGGYLVKIGQTLGYINKENLLRTDRFKPGQLIKALILDITEDTRGSRVTLSRSHPDFVKAVIMNEVPEVQAGIVTIDKIVRDPGSRTKLLVSSEEENVDPVGTILGRKNVRILNIMREISTTLVEKIDVIQNQPEYPETMIFDALEPAVISKVEISEDGTQALVHCAPKEAALAVGKRGVNIRLASELLDLGLEIVTEEEQETSPNLEIIVDE